MLTTMPLITKGVKVEDIRAMSKSRNNSTCHQWSPYTSLECPWLTLYWFSWICLQ